MIQSRDELWDYLKEDKISLGINHTFPSILVNEIWKFQISLRLYEYYTNMHSGGVGARIWRVINHLYSIRLGFTIPPNVFGKGLNIHHFGCIVVNSNARVGDYCNIQQCVNIGQNYTVENVPTIGNNVYIGPGAKIFGKITIADGCAIGAGAVVNKSFCTPNRVIVGNPARDVGARKKGLV